MRSTRLVAQRRRMPCGSGPALQLHRSSTTRARSSGVTRSSGIIRTTPNTASSKRRHLYHHRPSIIRLRHPSVAGLRAEHLDGTTPITEREAILARLASGETTIVTNCMVLTEGWDMPDVGCCILARPTKQMGLYRQPSAGGAWRFQRRGPCGQQVNLAPGHAANVSERLRWQRAFSTKPVLHALGTGVVGGGRAPEIAELGAQLAQKLGRFRQRPGRIE